MVRYSGDSGCFKSRGYSKSPYPPANSIPPETSLGGEYGKGRRQWPVGSDVILSKCVDSLVSSACLPALCFLMFCVGRASWQRSWLLRCFWFLGSALYLSHPFRYWSVHSFIKPGSCSVRHTVCNWPLAGVDRVAMTGGRRVQLLSQVQNYSSCSMNSALHTCKSWYCIHKNKKEFETPRTCSSTVPTSPASPILLISNNNSTR